jgi:carbamoyl-phosphate synthase large subunit
MTKPKYTIAVTGLNAIDNPGPGIPVIRGLREAKSFNVKIIGLAYESLEPGIFMHDIIDKTYQIPYPSAGTQFLYERIEYINSVENIDVLIPNFDAELYSFMKLESKLEELGIKMFLPEINHFEDRSKVNLFEFGKKNDFNVPNSKLLTETSDIAEFTKEFDYPVVIKGKFYDAYIVNNMAEAKSAFEKISSKWGLPVIAQEFINGTELNIIGLGDGKGGKIAYVPMRKQYITDKGKAWAGITIDNKDLEEITNRFIATNWKGGFELELIRTNDDKYYLLEINPRIPAWVYLAIGAGQNIPEAIVNLALGKKVKPYNSYHVGKLFIRHSWDLIVDLKEFEKISTLGEL